MSTKKPNEMKNAFQALRVNQPLRLPKAGPGLSPPKQMIQDEAPRKEVPLIDLATSELAHGEVPCSEVSEVKAPQIGQACKMPYERNDSLAGIPAEESSFGAPRIEVPFLQASHDEVLQIEVPQVEAPAKYQAQGEVTQKENAQQKVSRVEDAHFEQTHNEKTHKEVPLDDLPQERTVALSGFFKLSHSIFSEEVVRRMSGDCFRLFLWMSMRAWRFPESTGALRASVRFIEDETGMGHATISRALKTLKEARLVSVLDVDYKRGNVWRVTDLALNADTRRPKQSRKRDRNERPQNENANIEEVVTSKWVGSHLKISAEAPQNEDHYKNFKNLKNYSQEEIKPLLDRILAIESPRKAKIETTSLNAILEVFSPSKVLIALEDVEKRGTLSGAVCHSPFSYLALAISDVLKRASIPARTEPSVAEETLSGFQIALTCFEQELTQGEQVKVIEQFAESEYGNGFMPQPSTLRFLAAMAWFNKQTQSSKSLPE